MPDEKVTYAEAAATEKSLRRLPEESLRRARNILLNLDHDSIEVVLGRETAIEMGQDIDRAQRLCGFWAEALESNRPKSEEGGEHGQG